MSSSPIIKNKKNIKHPSLIMPIVERKPSDGKHRNSSETKSPPTKKQRIGTMESEKLSKVRPITERNALTQIISQVNKFFEFCEIHDLVSDLAHWKFEDFTTWLLDRYCSWLIKHGKTGKPFPSHHVYISGIKYFLERKFSEKTKSPSFQIGPSLALTSKAKSQQATKRGI